MGKIVPLTRKIMATIFQNSYGIIFNDYVEKGKTITELYYGYLLDQLHVELMKKLPHLKKKKILFHHNNTLAHMSAIAMAKIAELLPHPSYSPDLVPCDFFLFAYIKKKAWWKKRRSSLKTNVYLQSLRNHKFRKT